MKRNRYNFADITLYRYIGEATDKNGAVTGHYLNMTDFEFVRDNETIRVVGENSDYIIIYEAFCNRQNINKKEPIKYSVITKEEIVSLAMYVTGRCEKSKTLIQQSKYADFLYAEMIADAKYHKRIIINGENAEFQQRTSSAAPDGKKVWKTLLALPLQTGYLKG